ncbi:MAG: serine/threonine protein kinase [Deltaproteobacteria bacterium]|nr:serine/threonine protein kinase [Deltaproteobacteria bacterium]
MGPLLGEGESAEVYAATQRGSNRSAAIKIARAAIMPEKVRVERFEQEGIVLGRLRSPFVCELFATGSLDDGRPWIALELLEGETLRERMSREVSLPPHVVLKVADEVLQALVVAHAAGIVHRDLAPENIFLQRTLDGAMRTKVLDFGVARDERATFGRTGKGTSIGSYAYSAPEQLAGRDPVGPTADLYALGVILLEATCGRAPWGRLRGPALASIKAERDPPTLVELVEGAPRETSNYLRRLSARIPTRRFASAVAALTALRSLSRPRESAGRLAAEAALVQTTTLRKGRKGPAP